MATIKDYREREAYIKKANEVEQQYGIPNNLLVGLLKTESGFDKDVISGKRKSSAGAIGIAQFMPLTAKEFGIDPKDPIQSIEAAGRYLSQNYKKLGNWDDTLRSYNLGLGGVQKWKSGKRNLPKETAEYVGKVYKNAKIPYSATKASDKEIERTVRSYELPTTDLKDLYDEEENVNFTPEIEEEEPVTKKEDKDIKEVKEQTKEYNFLEEYKSVLNSQPLQQEVNAQEETVQQEPMPSLQDIYTNVSNFIDNDLVAQQGGSYYDLSMNSANPITSRQFTIDYIKSPKYKERLIKSGYKDPDKIIKDRLDKVSTVEEKNQYENVDGFERMWAEINGDLYHNSGSAYFPESNTVLIYSKADERIKNIKSSDRESIKAHEYTHAETKGFPLNKKDNSELYNRLFINKYDPEDNTLEEIKLQKEKANSSSYKNLPHALDPNENKADINALRFILKKDGIYDAGKENFNKEHLKKSPNNFIKKRLLENYSEEDLIWLMNNVADKSSNSDRYAQQGGVQQSQDFLQNWYSSRVLPDEKLNQDYQREKALYIEQAKYLPQPQYVEKIDDFNTQGTYDINSNQIQLLNTASPLVYTHEGTHKINLPLKDTQSNVNAFSIIGKNIIPREKIQNEWVRENYPSISNYQEIIPRLNSYRQFYNLKPDQVITPELIQQNREQYLREGQYEDNTDQLYKLFENEGLSNVLNKVVSNQNLSLDRYAQQGGLPVSSNGVYDYPMQDVIVPTTNGKITMNNVNYPILGIDEFGNEQLMQPGQEYQFKGTIITEYPQITEAEKNFLKHISQLK